MTRELAFSLSMLALASIIGSCNVSTETDDFKNPRSFSWKVDTLPHSQSGTIYMYDVWGDRPDNVYTAGSNANSSIGEPFLYHYDGEGWQPVQIQLVPTEAHVWITALFGFSATDIYATGARYFRGETTGLLLHFDGTSWQELTPNGASTKLNAIDGNSSGVVWVIGDSGSFYRLEHSSWEKLHMDSLVNLRRVASAPDGDAYLLGTKINDFSNPLTNYFQFIRAGSYYSTTLDSASLSTTYPHFGVSSLGHIGSTLYSIGNGVYKYREGVWARVWGPSYGSLLDITSFGGDNSLVVGQNSQVVHFNGTDWQTIDLPIDPDWTVDAAWIWKNEAMLVANRDGNTIVIHGE